MTSTGLTRRLLFALATSDRFEGGARSIPLVRQTAFRSALRYVAGERVESALELGARLDSEGVQVAIDFLGEQVGDPGEAEAAADAYVELARRIAGVPDASLALDLSHVGLDLSSELCRRRLERIVDALPPGRRLDIGAEDSGRTDASHEAVLALARDGAPIQMTLQANLLRSADDWAKLVDAGLAIRLVKGAYVERPDIAHPYGERTDVAYLRLAHELAEAGARVAIATPTASCARPSSPRSARSRSRCCSACAARTPVRSLGAGYRCDCTSRTGRSGSATGCAGWPSHGERAEAVCRRDSPGVEVSAALRRGLSAEVFGGETENPVVDRSDLPEASAQR